MYASQSTCTKMLVSTPVLEHCLKAEVLLQLRVLAALERRKVGSTEIN